MPLVPSFTAVATSDPSAILITDTSTGSDGAITDRVISLYTANNILFGTFDFPLSAGSSITITPLTKDISLNLVLNWNDNTGTPLYTASQIADFVGYAMLFLYGLSQFQISNPPIIADKNFYGNKMAVLVEVNNAQNAITTGNSVANSQAAILRYQVYIVNQNDYF